jgi:hypothetical protein
LDFLRRYFCSGKGNSQGITIAPPMLEHLSIIEDDYPYITDRTDLPQFPHSPKLHSLYLVDHIHMSFFRDEDAAHVQKLTLTKYLFGSVWASSDVTLIAQFSALRMLTLDDNDAEVDLRSHEIPPLAKLPLLETLILSGEVPKLLVDGLVVPALKTLEIQVVKWRAISLEVITPAILRSVENIYIVFKPGLEFQDEFFIKQLWLQHLERIIGWSPILQRVYISSALLERITEMGGLVKFRGSIELVAVSNWGRISH